MKKVALFFLLVVVLLSCQKTSESENSFTTYYWDITLKDSAGRSENDLSYGSFAIHQYKIDSAQNRTNFKEAIITGGGNAFDRWDGLILCKQLNGVDSITDGELAALYKIGSYNFVTDTLNQNGIIVNSWPNKNFPGFFSSRYGDQSGSTFQITRVQNSNNDEYHQLDISGKFSCKLYRESGKGDILWATGSFRVLAARKKMRRGSFSIKNSFSPASVCN